VLFHGRNIYEPGVDPIALRRHVGMVFQRPTPFPTMSIRDNVAAGLRVQLGERLDRRQVDEVVERALRQAALWDEVKDRLKSSATGISGGQQQRLCIARALATAPHVLLLDEPTASLDPLSTQKVEELVYELRSSMTVIIVTHNMQQAARVSDRTVFMLAGEMVRSCRGEGLVHDRGVLRSFDFEGAEVRIPAHHRDFGDRVVERKLRLLRDDRDAAREKRPRTRCERLPVECHRSAVRPPRPRQQPQQRRLAAAVRAENADERAVLDVERDPAQHR
jgi:ABC-type polar amino acid transport system ATPase subunit